MAARFEIIFAIVACVTLATTGNAQGQLPPAFSKHVPETLDDLIAIERHVQQLIDRVQPATVCLRIGGAQGSGVFIDREGRILTAGHVSGHAGREGTAILPEGRRLSIKTLGANNIIDSGMAILALKTDVPTLEMAPGGSVRRGDWCLALGHPNGFKPGRPPVARLGRVQDVTAMTIVTDCALVGGDSGGPLFDMHGRVIGIHSRIGNKVSSNVHVPIDTYHRTWDRLAAGQVWGSPNPALDFVRPQEAYLGVRPAVEKRGLRIEGVTPGSPAEKAGLKANDLILKMDNQALTSADDLAVFLKSRRPGTRIHVQVQRGDEVLSIPVALGQREG